MAEINKADTTEVKHNNHKTASDANPQKEKLQQNREKVKQAIHDNYEQNKELREKMMKNRQNTPWTLTPPIFFVVALFLVVVFSLLEFKKVRYDYPEPALDARSLNITWTAEDGAEVSLPNSPKIKAGTSVAYSATLPESLSDNMVICIRADQLDLNVFIDGALRLTYSTAETRVLGKVSPRRYLFLNVGAADSGKTITMELNCTLDNVGAVNVISYGTKYDVMASLIANNWKDIFVAFVMLIICIICLIGAIVMGICFGTFFEIIHLANMGILASVWILCNSEISQIFFTNASLSIIVDYLMLMALPFPFLFFMNDAQERRYNKVYLIFEYIAMVEVVICTGLQLTHTYDLAELFFAIAGVFASALIMILITISIDLFKKKNYDYFIIAIGIFAGILATLLQFALFLSGVIAFGGSAVAIALLIMLITAVIDTFKKIKKTELERQVAVAEGKAESSFLANMSHEIRTPINAVIGMNQMILRETTDDQIREYAEDIESSGTMLLSIINDILDFSKIRSGNMQIIADKYNLFKMISAAEDMISPRAELKELAFSVDIEKSLPNIMIGDEVRIKQIIINLLTNAVKYTEKGSFGLKVFADDRTEDYLTLCIEVSDTGKGIKEEDQKVLFESFRRVDEKNNRNIEGTGLGLALVHRLITAMGGTIEVESTYGEGSTFKVRIPQEYVAGETIADVSAAPRREKAVVADKALFTAPEAQILLVDDTRMNLTVTKGLLKRTKVNVTLAGSGGECLEILKTRKFDVVLLDHLMPVMDGQETLNQIKKDNLAPDTKIIVLTANAIEGSREMYLNMGFDDYLSKPVIPAALEEILCRYIPKDKITMNDTE